MNTEQSPESRFDGMTVGELKRLTGCLGEFVAQLEEYDDDDTVTEDMIAFLKEIALVGNAAGQFLCSRMC